MEKMFCRLTSTNAPTCSKESLWKPTFWWRSIQICKCPKLQYLFPFWENEI